jgi:hypothetical protein
MKKTILCCVFVLALGCLALAQSTTQMEFDLAIHCAGPGPVTGFASLNLQMTTMVNLKIPQLRCSDTTSRGDTAHFTLDGTLVGFQGQVNASGTGDIQGCAFAGTTLPFEITCEDTTSSPTRRVRYTIQ